MSYQVLARKWRPRNFASLVGQEHVVKALSHALNDGRLHHAYLFTGTRGVGKTTLARILAKALNCETGVTDSPCGVCSTCLEIDSGRFVDYIEMDAASNRGVDDMTQLLEQATYSPSRGRYKVYVIDEVHQLSGHAFNAMLKTLEEPPEHVKFVLATTDPQKIPVTVLSRCLQFNLKQMPDASVVDHLSYVLGEENIAAEVPALRLIARAGAGSMRDALSLLDQAIAHGAGRVTESDVRDMLGTVDADHVFAVFDALLAGDADALMRIVDALASRSLSFDGALQELASLAVRIQVAQFSPQAVGDEDPNRRRTLDLAASINPEFVQLAYQIAVQGRQDLPFAPDAASGFAMTLLRLFAFRQESRVGARPQDMKSRSQESVVTPSGAPPLSPTSAPTSAPLPVAGSLPQAETARVRQFPVASCQSAIGVSSCWREVIQSLRLSGMVRELAQHCELRDQNDNSIRLCLAPAHRHLLVKASHDKFQQVLSEYFGRPVRVSIDLEDPAGETPATQVQRERRVLQDNAVAAIEGDGFVREVVELFDATLLESSIKPIA